MPTVVKSAENALELNDVLRVRFEVLRDSGASLAQHFRKIEKVMDHFDVYPTTHHMVIYKEGQTVGALRALEYDPADALQNELYNFRDSYKNLTDKCALLDTCVLKASSFVDPLWVMHEALSSMALSLLFRGIQYLFWVRPHSWRQTVSFPGEKVLCEDLRALDDREPSEALLLSLAAIQAQFVARIKDKEILRFQEIFYRALFEPGELLIVEGEKGSTSYLIEQGEVEVVRTTPEKVIPLKSINAGHMVGEIAMVTNEPRTASILATKRTSCVAFDRDEFMRLMYAEPARSVDIFRIFSKRIKEANQQIVNQSSERLS